MSERKTLIFVTLMCLICGSLLSVIAFSLREPQEAAKAFDRNVQMLIAAKVIDHKGYFIEINDKGEIERARLDFKSGKMTVDENAPRASDEEIQKLSDALIRPLLTDSKGKIYTLEQKKIELATYLEENKDSGYADLPFKLLYIILPLEDITKKISAEEALKEVEKAKAVVVPISGFGLWAPIYGYIALKTDGNTVIGTTWYEMAETPGLGANITESKWQKQFYGKEIFQQASQEKVDLQTADIGILVVKGKAEDLFGGSPKLKSAVDGISGATLTGEGVTAAYKNSLTPYREFFVELQKGEKKDD